MCGAGLHWSVCFITVAALPHRNGRTNGRLPQSAEAEYRELLSQFPQYGDCCLRLACIAKARGDTKVSRHNSFVCCPLLVWHGCLVVPGGAP